MPQFSIADQSVTLPDGSVLQFRTNPENAALVEIRQVGRDKDGVEGSYVLSFNRHGGPTSVGFQPRPVPLKPPEDTPEQAEAKAKAKDEADKLAAAKAAANPALVPLAPFVPGTPVFADGPLAGFKSVNDDAVRGPLPDPNAKPMGTVVSPVHGVVNTTGLQPNPPFNTPSPNTVITPNPGNTAPKPTPVI